MYAVVGCGECSALWVVADEPETTGCPRCGKRHRFDRLRRFVETGDEDHAREVRASMLAARQDHEEAFADLDSFAGMAADLDDAGLDDDEYLAASGIDADEVAAAGDRAMENRAGGDGPNPREAVLDALRDLDEPEEADVLARTDERGVDRERAREALRKLVRRGRVSESGGLLRLV